MNMQQLSIALRSSVNKLEEYSKHRPKREETIQKQIDLGNLIIDVMESKGLTPKYEKIIENRLKEREIILDKLFS